jgi:DNA-binding NarL/FixJ family response regulator
MPATRSDAPSVIRVLIADDHAVVREGIRHVLSSESGFEVVGEAADGREAVALARALRPAVVVLDLSMPELSGLEAAAQIRTAAPRTAILILSIHDHEEYVVQSVRAGVQGYLRKDAPPAELRTAIRALSTGGNYFGAPVAHALSSATRSSRTEDAQSRIATLTPREKEVLIEIARGSANKDIAKRFGISVRTVESHREALMKKLGLRGVASLTRFALDAGLLTTIRKP